VRSICVELIDNVVAAGPNTSNGFFQAYYLPLLSDMFFVLTDADHKSGKSPYLYFLSLAITQLIDAFTIGFKSTALVLARLIRLVETGDIQVPLDPSVTSAPGNSAFVAEHSANLLKQAFPHLQLFVFCSHFSCAVTVMLTPLEPYRSSITAFISALREQYGDFNKFRITLRDFLSTLLPFSL